MIAATIQQQYSKLKQFYFRALISSPKENSVTSGNLVYFGRLKSGTTSSSVWRTLFSICVASLNMYSLWMDVILIHRNPIRSRPFCILPWKLENMRKEIQRLLDLRVNEVGQFDYALHMILVESPGKDPRFYIIFQSSEY